MKLQIQELKDELEAAKNQISSFARVKDEDEKSIGKEDDGEDDDEDDDEEEDEDDSDMFNGHDQQEDANARTDRIEREVSLKIIADVKTRGHPLFVGTQTGPTHRTDSSCQEGTVCTWKSLQLNTSRYGN
jgi:hypothetical protein